MNDLWRPPCPCGADCLRAHASQVSSLTAAGRALAAAGVLLTAVLGLRGANRVARGLLRAMGIRWSMVGAQIRPGALLTGNHVSWLDIVVMMAVAPAALPARAVGPRIASASDGGRPGASPTGSPARAVGPGAGPTGSPARAVGPGASPTGSPARAVGPGASPTGSPARAVGPRAGSAGGRAVGRSGSTPSLRMVAKIEVAGWPVIGRLASAAGTIFVDRSRPLSLPRTVAEVADALRGGDAVQVFPEGTTTCGAHPVRWRPAFLQAALDAGAPVQRFTLLFSTQKAAFVDDESLLTSLWRVLRLRGLSVTVLIDEAQPVGAATRRELAARLSPKRHGLQQRVDHGRRA